MTTSALPTPGLEVRRTRAWVALALVPVLLLVAAGVWFVTHPAPLETTTVPVQATAPVGVAVYVGVYRLPADADRTLHLSDVDVADDGEAEVAVAALVCHGSALNVTSTPTTFCPDLEPASDATMRPGDQLVLQVAGESAGSVTISPPRVSYRDALQRATQPAGRPVELTVLAR
ncbi:hypothetical protein H5V45_21450 [Nocardioides sp. KIGAM211]|uniref:Uncharacterized protein n=1 Tax=Nocardioides luti TaxID=2761101 RepID=A0A7X0RKM8_9ACTN|nr:hypothetical protein [Nocardioides luti]MBB6629897.1 hypothetical protein [Nocardioides luti]